MRCRFNAPWPVCEQTMIVRGDDVPNDVIKKSKKICDKVLNEISNNRREEELDQLTFKDILDSCEVTQDEYDNAMNTMQKSSRKVQLFITNDNQMRQWLVLITHPYQVF